MNSAKIFGAFCTIASSLVLLAWAQTPSPPPQKDAIAEAQRPSPVKATRPEQQKNAHDTSDAFHPVKAQSASPALRTQPKQGKLSGFDFARDPLNADKPNQSPEEIMKGEIENKPGVMAAHRKLLESRYILEPKLDPQVKMTRGKPLPVGPTARLQGGMTWQQLGDMRPEDIKQRGIFPYPSLPHPLQTNGGQGFPKMQIDMFPRLEIVHQHHSQQQ